MKPRLNCWRIHSSGQRTFAKSQRPLSTLLPRGLVQARIASPSQPIFNLSLGQQTWPQLSRHLRWLAPQQYDRDLVMVKLSHHPLRVINYGSLRDSSLNGSRERVVMLTKNWALIEWPHEAPCLLVAILEQLYLMNPPWCKCIRPKVLSVFFVCDLREGFIGRLLQPGSM